MRVDVGLLVGNGPNAYAWASKTIDLNFAPVPGMEFSDGTWKGGDGRQIIAVSIECPPPPDKPYLAVALAPDQSAPKDQLAPMYEAHGWALH